MQCFNCGNDADMEVFMMINGKMKKLSICMECYQEQLGKMMEDFQDENGEFNPDLMQKRMFEFMKNNKDEFEKFIQDAIEDKNFDMNNLNPENIDFKKLDMTNFNPEDFDMSKFVNYTNGFDFKKMVDFGNLFNQNSKENITDSIRRDGYNDNFEKLTKDEKDIYLLQKAVAKKKIQLSDNLNNQDYLAAATTRDEMREINKKIMIIKTKTLEKEGEI